MQAEIKNLLKQEDQKHMGITAKDPLVQNFNACVDMLNTLDSEIEKTKGEIEQLLSI
jgi:hypothetical protein